MFDLIVRSYCTFIPYICVFSVIGILADAVISAFRGKW